MMGRERGQPAAGREGIIGTSTCDGEGEGTASCTGREGRARLMGRGERTASYSSPFWYLCVLFDLQTKGQIQ